MRSLCALCGAGNAVPEKRPSSRVPSYTSTKSPLFPSAISEKVKTIMPGADGRICHSQNWLLWYEKPVPNPDPSVTTPDLPVSCNVPWQNSVLTMLAAAVEKGGGEEFSLCAEGGDVGNGGGAGIDVMLPRYTTRYTVLCISSVKSKAPSKPTTPTGRPHASGPLGLERNPATNSSYPPDGRLLPSNGAKTTV
jgi:hypothetical protein